MANGRGIRAGRAFVELGVSDRLTAGLRRAQKRLRAFGAGVRKAGVGLLAAGAAATAFLAVSVRAFTKAGDELEKMSRRTGFSAEALSELAFAAEQSGADLGTLEKGVRTMQRAVNDLGRGLSTQVDAFGDLGLALADLEGLSPEEQFKLIAERLSQVEDATKRAAIAQQIFGRAGTRLLPLMEDGARGIEALQEEARRLGLTISTKTAKDAAALADAFNRIRKIVRVVLVNIGAALAPIMLELAERTKNAAIAVNTWVKENQGLIITAAKVAALVTGIGGALVATGVAFQVAAFVVRGFITAIAAVKAIMAAVAIVLGALLSPVGLVVAALGVGGAVFFAFSDAGKAALDFLGARFRTLGAIFGDTLRGMGDALKAGDVSLGATVLWKSLKVLWLEGKTALVRVWDDAFDAMLRITANAIAAIRQLLLELARGPSSVALRALRNVSNALGQPEFAAFFNALDAAGAASSAQSARDIAQGLIDDLAGIDAGAEERIKKQAEALGKARSELDAAIEEARRARERASAPGVGGLGGTAPSAPDFDASLDEIAEGVSRRVSSVGQFQGFNFLGLQSSRSSIDRTAKATEETSRNTLRLLEEQLKRTGGLTFA